MSNLQSTPLPAGLGAPQAGTHHGMPRQERVASAFCVCLLCGDRGQNKRDRTRRLRAASRLALRTIHVEHDEIHPEVLPEHCRRSCCIEGAEGN